MASANGGLLRQNPDKSEAMTRTESDLPPAPDQEMPLDHSLVNDRRRQPGDHSDYQAGVATARDAPALPSKRPLPAAESANAAGRATVSWTKATAALRENLLTLQQKLKEEGHLAAKERERERERESMACSPTISSSTATISSASTRPSSAPPRSCGC